MPKATSDRFSKLWLFNDVLNTSTTLCLNSGQLSLYSARTWDSSSLTSFSPLFSMMLRLWSKAHFASSSSWQSTLQYINTWELGSTLWVAAAVRLLNGFEDKSNLWTAQSTVWVFIPPEFLALHLTPQMASSEQLNGCRMNRSSSDFAS